MVELSQVIANIYWRLRNICSCRILQIHPKLGRSWFHILLVQAALKAKAKEMDERGDEEERMRRGEDSAICSVFSDEVS